jgi:light-regulated signal transduction histidine kinase (bacteriophytochrome)
MFTFPDIIIGLIPSNFRRIFITFKRLHSGDEIDGNGIGPANSQKIIELINGEVGVESKLGHESTFHFTIHELTL